ncbi:MAG: lipoprotein insertase outer membrane protein LolB [Gammaproteobacteria bacterium]
MKFAGLLTLVLLTACSNIPRQDSEPFAPHPLLEPWHSWQFSGRISIRTEANGWFAGLRWLQSGDRYQLYIQGPFGQGAVEVVGDGEYVRLRAGDGRIYVDRDAESLIYQVLGVKVPVAGLRYWVHGLSDPGQPEQSRWNREGVRSELRQAGWIIHYQKYVSVADRRLPTKIRMENKELQIRLQIDNWQKGAPDIPRIRSALTVFSNSI